PASGSGSGSRHSTLDTRPSFRFQYKGLFPAIDEASRVSYVYRQRFYEMVGEVPCPACGGSRLRADAAAMRFQGKTLQQLCSLPLDEALAFLKGVKINAADRRVAGDLLTEATSRLSFLVDVGLEYVTLSRTLPTLSGGEMQRIRLAGQIGRALTGVLYVLDEPTIGLHPRDNGRLLAALKKLRDLGNTVVLVEHDREVLWAADRLYDFGPGAGRLGGTVTGEGRPRELARKRASLTGQFLSGRREIVIPKQRRMASVFEGEQSTKHKAQSTTQHWLELLGCRHNNLKNVDLRIPLGTFTCVTGVSGSGKSSLIEDTLAKAVTRKLHRSSDTPAPHDELRGLEHVNKVIVVDQQPIGTTPASNPATYTGVFDHIRELFARLPEAKVRGYRPARFSFNRPGGRCEDCEGNGRKCIEMHFLPDVWVECETCRGNRYNRETLAVKYRDCSIADVLEMPIGQARELFDNIPKIRGYLETLCAIGLDYLTLGQPAPTLSGGEAQRVKLAAELARPGTGRTLYLLDEPTTGLHFDDIDKLLKVLNSLVELGNTVVVIEHNLDVIKTADWLIDLGPEAGAGGGWIVVEGTPEDVVRMAEGRGSRVKGQGPEAEVAPLTTHHSPLTRLRSHTGELLAPVLAAGTRADREVFDASAARKKRSGDLDLQHVGRDAKMPWQTDGRRWHTVDRVAHNGNACRWEGAALAFVLDWLDEAGGFSPPNWNHRSVVEVTAEKPSRRNGSNGRRSNGAHEAALAGWFLHAQTGDEWLLTLKFRVKKNTFREEDLQEQLALRPWDDIDELPVYGRSDRVRVKNLKGPWQEVTITVHWLREIDTPEFRQFLADACAGFAAVSGAQRVKPADITPWKVLGRRWHLSRKGFPSGKRVAWEPHTLDRLFDLLLEAFPQAEIDWSGKQSVSVRSPAGNETLATVHTKRRGGIDLELYVEPGSVALGRIAELGAAREIARHRDGRDAVKIRFRMLAETTARAVQEFLQERTAVAASP
ncbi:MAG TPA: excinuclease ABC subunit UvrA, partial [Planctomycetaceae bacterium]|nr:excinuclease ABC subunit UvrA [Planctomycetaceae bacterium]